MGIFIVHKLKEEYEMVCTPEELIMGDKTHETSSYDSVRGVVQAWTGWFVNLEEDEINC